jgi:hypothetical protein
MLKLVIECIVTLYFAFLFVTDLYSGAIPLWEIFAVLLATVLSGFFAYTHWRESKREGPDD